MIWLVLNVVVVLTHSKVLFVVVLQRELWPAPLQLTLDPGLHVETSLLQRESTCMVTCSTSSRLFSPCLMVHEHAHSVQDDKNLTSHRRKMKRVTETSRKPRIIPTVLKPSISHTASYPSSPRCFDQVNSPVSEVTMEKGHQESKEQIIDQCLEV